MQPTTLCERSYGRRDTLTVTFDVSSLVTMDSRSGAFDRVTLSSMTDRLAGTAAGLMFEDTYSERERNAAR